MESRPREYAAQDIVVTYDVVRCIHAAECIRGLPQVFDTDKRPWIQPQQATADELAAQIVRCPSGALHFRRLDGGAEEIPDPSVTVTPVTNGPLYLRGDIGLRLPGGDEVSRETRVALCRCGHSENKPFCDNSHERVGFEAQ